MCRNVNIYKLQHRDDLVALMAMDESGSYIKNLDVREPSLMPLQAWNGVQGLRRWWQQRQVPIRQDGLQAMLQTFQLDSTSQFLLNNLGLSLNDCYWVQPLSENLRWKDVSLFVNHFSERYMPDADDEYDFPYTPISSTGGTLMKRWIIRNGKRMLIKGNQRGSTAQQSMNEVFAGRLHRMQGCKNYVEYTAGTFRPQKEKKNSYAAFQKTSAVKI